MDYADELHAIMQRLPEIYREGDIAGYLAHYALDISAFYSGTVMEGDEAHKYIASLFEGGGKTIKFEMGIPLVRFNDTSEAAIISYPWREHFQYSDGRATDTAYYETDVWYRRQGKWQIVNVHQSTVREYTVALSSRVRA